VAVSWPTTGQLATQLAVRCRQKGAAEWQTCHRSDAGEFDTLPSNLPASYEVFRFRPGPDTTWEFQVVQERPRTGSTPFTAAVFSAVREAQIFPSLDNVGFEAGRSLPIRAELRRDGVGVTGATVNAVVRVPTHNFGATLRRYAGQFSPPGTGDSRALAMTQQLQGFLARDTGSEQIHSYREVPVKLRDDGSNGDEIAGDGIYSGVLPGSETEVAGDYRVTITAELSLPSGRTVRRVARLSALCDVGPADPSRSIVRTVLQADDANDFRMATVLVQPTDRFGNAAFPGSGSQVQVVPTGATLAGDLVDNLDSTFTQALRLDGPTADARVEVLVGGVSLGTVPVVPRPAGEYELSFHLGLAIPHGTFGSVFDDGPSLGIDVARRLDNNLAIKLELVSDDFDFALGGSEEMLNLSAYLQYRKPRGPWTPYFETGLGLYDFFDTTALGYSAGLGLMRRITPRWSLDLNLQGHRVGGSLDVGFSRFRVGALYDF
jgi:hypothetical protein